MELFFSVLNISEKLIEFLKLSYILWKVNGDCSKTCFSLIMHVFCVLFTGKKCTIYDETFFSMLFVSETIIDYLKLSYNVS